jgi:hypothetical protein
MHQLSARANAGRQLSALSGWRFGCVEHLVLELGEWFEPPPQTVAVDNAEVYSLWADWVRRIPDLLYVEGWLLDHDDQPKYGAWCIHGDTSLATAPTAQAYIGIPLAAQFHQHRTDNADTAGHHGRRLDRVQFLRFGLPWEAVPDLADPRPQPHPRLALVTHANAQSGRSTA